MDESNNKLQKFYATGEYKGFRKLSETNFKLLGKTHLTFTNGKKNFLPRVYLKNKRWQKLSIVLISIVPINS